MPRERVVLIDGDATKLGTTEVLGEPALNVAVVSSSASTSGYAQGSTTSGQLGPLVQGAVTDEFPATYADGETWPLSLDTSGGLRVSQVTSPWVVSMTSPSGSSGGLAGTQDADFTTSESIAQIFLVITGSWTGTISFLASDDLVTYFTIRAFPEGTGAVATSTTANGQWRIPFAGLRGLRISAVLSAGTATYDIRPSFDPNIVQAFNLNASNFLATVSGSVTANAGTNLNTSALALESGGNLAAAAASLSVLDDWDESDRAKVNPIAGQAGVQGGSGAVSALTQRVVLATDVALPTGSNVIGAVTQSGTWTVQPGNTANSTAWLVTGTGGTFPVTDSGGSLTVDNGGTFAVQATIAAAATNIAKAEDSASADADVGVPALAVRKATPANTSGTDGDYEFLQMSAGRLWVDPSGVTLTVASHAVTNAGTFAVQVTDVVPGTGATNLGKAEDAAHSSGDTGVMALAVRADTAAATGANGDYVPLLTDALGMLHASHVQSSRVATPTLSNVSSSATSVTLLSANTSRRQVVLVNDSTAICYVKFGTTASSTDYTFQMAGSANSQVSTLIIEEPTLYTGRIDAIWASATGAMRVTEVAT